MTAEPTARPAWRRWAFNLALFYGLLLAVGLTAGVIGALGEDRFNTGQSGTIIYSPGPDDPPGTEPTVVVEGITPEPGFLLLYPALALFFGTLWALPFTLIGLAVAELVAFLGMSETSIRMVGLVIVALFSLLLASSNGAGLLVLIVMGGLAFASLARLPSARVAQAARINSA